MPAIEKNVHDRVDTAMFVWAGVECYGFKNRSIFPQTKTAGSSLQEANLLVLTNSDGGSFGSFTGEQSSNLGSGRSR